MNIWTWDILFGRIDTIPGYISVFLQNQLQGQRAGSLLNPHSSSSTEALLSKFWHTMNSEHILDSIGLNDFRSIKLVKNSIIHELNLKIGDYTNFQQVIGGDS